MPMVTGYFGTVTETLCSSGPQKQAKLKVTGVVSKVDVEEGRQDPT